MSLVRRAVVNNGLLLLTASIVLFPLGTAMCVELTEKIPTADKFTIRLPSGWVPIPKADLDALYAMQKKLAPNEKIQPTAYGFLRSGSDEYPRIMITMRTIGRIPDEKLQKDFGRFEAGAKQGVSELNYLAPLVSNISLGESKYDPVHRVIWMRLQSNVEGQGVIKGIGALRLTRNGYIQISCFVKEDSFKSLSPDFIEIITGLELAPEIEYSPINKK